MTLLQRSTLLRHLLVALAGGAVLFGITDMLGEFRNGQQVTAIAYTACAAAGLTVLTGLSGQISLGQGGFMAIGAYTVALILGKWQSSHDNLVLLVALIASVVVSAAAGVLVGVAAARLRGPYLAGATLAFAIGLPSLAIWSELSPHLGGSAGLNFAVANSPGGIDFQRWQAWICCLAALIVLLAVANLARSRVGRAFRAVRDDEIAASLAGLPVARIQVLAFVISAACAGLGGGLLAMVNQNVGPGGFGLSLSLSLLAVVVLGGLGTVTGVVLGSILVGLLPFWATDLQNGLSLSDQVANNVPAAVYGVVLMLAMLVFPFGLFGIVSRLWRRAVGQVTGATRTAGATRVRT